MTPAERLALIAKQLDQVGDESCKASLEFGKLLLSPILEFKKAKALLNDAEKSDPLLQKWDPVNSSKPLLSLGAGKFKATPSSDFLAAAEFFFQHEKFSW